MVQTMTQVTQDLASIIPPGLENNDDSDSGSVEMDMSNKNLVDVLAEVADSEVERD
jgi:hypothetical protein